MKKPNELFRAAQRRALTASYQNKYKRGDVVMNKEYGVISLIVEVIYGDEYRSIQWNKRTEFVEVKNSAVKYELKDIKNDKSQKDITKKPSRYRECNIIDKFYEQVNPEMARLLYGVG